MATYEDVLTLRMETAQANRGLSEIGRSLDATSRQLNDLSSKPWPISVRDNASGALSAISKHAMDLARAPIDLVVNVVDRASGVLASIGDAASAMVNTVATGATVATGVVTGMAASLSATGLNYIDLWQRSTAAWTTLLGTADRANAMMDELAQFSATVPFGRATWIEATQQLLGFGYEAKNVVPTLDALANAVAATGGQAGDVQDLAAIFAKIYSTNTIGSLQFQQLGMRGINAFKLIADQAGVTEQEIRESMKTGVGEGRAVLERLTTAMSGQYAGAATNVAKTWSGMLGGIQSRLRDLGTALAEPFVSRTGGGILIEWGVAFTDVLASFNKVLAPFMFELVGRFMPALERVRDWLRGLATTLKGFDPSGVKGFVDQLARMAPLLAPIAAALLSMGGANIASMLPLGLGNLIPQLNPLVAALGALVLSTPKVRDTVVHLGRAIHTAFTRDVGALGVVNDLIESTFGPHIAGLIRPGLQWLMDFFGGFQIGGDTIGLFARYLQNAFRVRVIPVLQDVGRWLKEWVLPPLLRLGEWIISTGLPALGRFAGWIRQYVLPALLRIAEFVLGRVVPALGDLASWFGENIMPRLARFAEFILEEVVPRLLDLAGWIMDRVVPALGRIWEGLQPVLDALQALAGWLAVHIVPLLASLVGWIVEHVLDALGDFAEMVGQVAQGFMDAKQDGDMDWFVEILEIMGEIGRDVMDILAELGLTTRSAGDEMAEGFDTAYAAGYSFRQFVIEVGGVVRDLFRMVADVVKLIRGVAGIQLSFAGGRPQISGLEQFQDIWAEVAPRQFPSFYQGGQGLVEALTDGIESEMELPAAAASALAQYSMDQASTQFAASPEIGQAFAEGLASGMTDNAGLPEEASKSVGRKALDAIKGVLGIRSPAAELQDVGLSMMQGLAEGISGNVNLVTSAMSQLGNAIRSQMQSMLSGLGGLGGAMMGAAATVGSGELQDAARAAAQRYGIDPELFARQIQQESGFNPNAVSPAGARGVAQIMPATAAAWGVNPNDPLAALDAAARNMGSYIQTYGGWENALRAYNAGPGAIAASRGYAETNQYVRTILGASYDDGGWLPPGVSLAGNFTGQPERVMAPGERTVTVNLGGLTVNAPGGDAASLRAIVPALAEQLLSYITPQLELALANQV